MSNNSNNNLEKVKETELLRNGDFIEPLPINLLRNQIMKTEHPYIFERLSSLFSNSPHSSVNILFNTQPLYKELIGDAIYLNQKLNNIDAKFDFQTYEYGYMLRVGTKIGNFSIETQTINVKKTLTDFLSSDKRIYYGFIKLGSIIPTSILSRLTSVGGHMNSFIIDKEIKSIIHFEPKGAFSIFSIWKGIDIVKYLNDILDDNSLEGYTLITTKTPSISFKTPQFADIYCQTYSIYAVLLYCLNQNVITQNTDFTSIILKLFKMMSLEKAIIFQNYFYCVFNETVGWSRRDIPEICDAFKDIKDTHIKQFTTTTNNTKKSKKIKAAEPKTSNGNKINSGFTLVNGGSKKNIKLKKYKTKKHNRSKSIK